MHTAVLMCNDLTYETMIHVKPLSNGTVHSTSACVPLNGSIECGGVGGVLVEAAFNRNIKTFLCLCIYTFYLIYVHPLLLGLVALSFIIFNDMTSYPQWEVWWTDKHTYWNLEL